MIESLKISLSNLKANRDNLAQRAFDTKYSAAHYEKLVDNAEKEVQNLNLRIESLQNQIQLLKDDDELLISFTHMYDRILVCVKGKKARYVVPSPTEFELFT